MLAAAVFCVVCLGSAATTYEAGTAVPDWVDWGVLLGHSHRALVQLTGVAALLLAVAIWFWDERKWMRWIAAAVLIGLLAQTSLSGIGVLSGDRLPDRVHGCLAPLYFALCAAVVAWTSQPWRESATLPSGGIFYQRSKHRRRADRRTRRLAWLLTAAVCLEIVFGVPLRRLSTGALSDMTALWVWLKVLDGGLIVLGVGWLAADILRRLRGEAMLVHRALWLACITIVQVTLSAVAWVANYGWPQWFTGGVSPWPDTVVVHGPLRVLATTAHVAVGALVLAASLSLAMWLSRSAERK
jgi:heme a synthase